MQFISLEHREEDARLSSVKELSRKQKVSGYLTDAFIAIVLRQSPDGCRILNAMPSALMPCDVLRRLHACILLTSFIHMSGAYTRQRGI